MISLVCVYDKVYTGIFEVKQMTLYARVAWTNNEPHKPFKVDKQKRLLCQTIPCFLDKIIQTTGLISTYFRTMESNIKFPQQWKLAL